MCFINAIFIITVNRSSTRVGSVVINNGAYLIVVAVAVLIETIGTVMIPKQQGDQHEFWH